MSIARLFAGGEVQAESRGEIGQVGNRGLAQHFLQFHELEQGADHLSLLRLGLGEKLRIAQIAG